MLTLLLQCPETEVQAEPLRAEGRQADQTADFHEHGFQSALRETVAVSDVLGRAVAGGS